MVTINNIVGNSDISNDSRAYRALSKIMMATVMIHIRRKSTIAVGMGITKAMTMATTNIPISDSLLNKDDTPSPLSTKIIHCA
jgi:hypothetical protein